MSGAADDFIRLGAIAHPCFHVFAGPPVPAPATPDIAERYRRARARSGGSGTTEAAARLAAAGEAAERAATWFRGDEPRISASLEDLGPAAIDPASCMLLSTAQYAMGAQGLRRLDPALVMDWSPVWSLSREECRWLPTAMLYDDCRHLPGGAECAFDSNGCAAGTTRDDAVVRGFLELAERDAIAIWWYHRLARPAVEIDTQHDHWRRDLAGAYREIGRAFHVLDLTTDLGIPVAAAVTRRLDGPPEEILFGFGAHADPEIAVTHALTEMNQMVASLASMADETWCLDDLLREWLGTATLATEPWLSPAGGPRPAADLRRPRAPASANLDDCLALVRQQGLELFAVDCARAGTQFPVVRAIVPGLRPALPRFAPGRLYDVPVALGWQAVPAPEASLNPWPFFL